MFYKDQNQGKKVALTEVGQIAKVGQIVNKDYFSPIHKKKLTKLDMDDAQGW